MLKRQKYIRVQTMVNSMANWALSAFFVFIYIIHKATLRKQVVLGNSLIIFWLILDIGSVKKEKEVYTFKKLKFIILYVMEPRDYVDTTNWADELFWYHLDFIFSNAGS